MSTAYKIEGGEITEYEIPDGGLVIQAARDWVQTIRGGTEHKHARAMLPVIQEIAERVTPGTTWWVAPSLERDKEDDSEWMRIAYRVSGVIFVSSNQSPRHLVHPPLLHVHRRKDRHAVRFQTGAIDAPITLLDRSAMENLDSLQVIRHEADVHLLRPSAQTGPDHRRDTAGNHGVVRQ